MMRRLGLAAALAAGIVAALAPGARAQSQPAYQLGTVKGNDMLKAVRNGQHQDAGGLLGDINGVGVNPFAITDGNGLGQCFNTGPTGQPYYALCFGHDTDGTALITVDSYGAAQKPLNFKINGQVITLPGAGTGDVTGPTASTSGHVALFGSADGKQIDDGGQLGTAAYAATGTANHTVAYNDGGFTQSGTSNFTGPVEINGNVQNILAPPTPESVSFGAAVNGAYDVDPSGAAVTATLPPDPVAGNLVLIRDATGAAVVNAITLDGNGADIEGAATDAITTPYGYEKLRFNGTQWAQVP